jgi:GxxExxY protein
MPVTVHAETRRLSSEEFGGIAYEVMQHAFAVHNEFGRCFDEDVYQREIAGRCGGLIEVPVEVTHGGFRKHYFLDLLVGQGAVFEIKTAAALTDRHRNQLLFYLLLTELSRGKLINMRTASVQHEFVNAPLTLADRIALTVDDEGWESAAPGAAELRERCITLLRDFGTGLSVALYEEALIHLLGGEDRVRREVHVISGGREIGVQRLPLTAPVAAFRITTLKHQARPAFAVHLRRFLSHTPLQFLHWINIYRETVTFATLQR